MSKDREKILERIRQLVSLGEGTNFEAEASLALERARKLMLQYDVEEYEIEMSGAGHVRYDIKQSTFDLGGLKSTWKARYEVLWSVGRAFDVEAVIYTTSKSKISSGEGLLYGTASDLKATKMVWESLSKQFGKQISQGVERLKEDADLFGGPSLREYRLGFYSGLSWAIRQRINQANEDLMGDESTALVVVSKQEAVKEAMGETRPLKLQQARNSLSYRAGVDRGRSVGDSVDLSGNRLASRA